MKGARSLLFEILGCGLLLVAAFGIFWSTPDPEWTRSKTEGRTSQESRAPLVVEGSAERKPAPQPPRPRPPSRPLRGTLTVVDDRGSPVANPGGTLFLRVESSDATTETHALAVREGRFETSVPIGSFLSADTATLDGRYAVVVLPRTALPASGRLDLTATIARWIEVRVEDAETSTPLRNVSLLAASGPPEHDLRPRGSADSLEAVGMVQDSPLHLAPDLSWIDAWVDVPGYAFGRFQWSPTRSDETVVRLPRPASLRVTFARPVPTRAAVRLRLFEPGPLSFSELDKQCYDAPVTSSNPIVLERIRPTTLRVRLVGFGSLPPVLAEQVVATHAGSMTEVILDPADSPPLHITGTLRIGAGWDPVPPTLRCFARPNGNEPWQSVADLAIANLIKLDDATLRFEIDVPRADLRFEWLDSGFAFDVLVHELEAPIEKSVPAATWVTLRFQDESGRDVEIERVRVTCLDHAGSSLLASPVAEDSMLRYRVRLPTGPIAIDLEDPHVHFTNGERRRTALAGPGNDSLQFQVELTK